MADQTLGLRAGYMAFGPGVEGEALARLVEQRATGHFQRLVWSDPDLERWAQQVRPHLLYLHVSDPGGGPGLSGDRLQNLRTEAPFLRIVQWLTRPDLYVSEPVRPVLASRIGACDLTLVSDQRLQAQLAPFGSVLALPSGYVPGSDEPAPVETGLILFVGDNVWLGELDLGLTQGPWARARWSDPGRERVLLVEGLVQRWPDRLLLLGQGWPYPSEAVPFELARPFYGRAQLAVVHSLYRDRPGHVPIELVWSLDAGRPTLVRYVPGLEQWFQHGVHCLFWQTLEECFSQCQRLLLDPETGQQLGRAGRDWVRAQHSWEQRLEQVFAILGLGDRGFEFIGLDRPERERVRMVRARPS